MAFSLRLNRILVSTAGSTGEPVPAANLPPPRSGRPFYQVTRIERAEYADLLSLGGPWKAKIAVRSVGQETTDRVLPLRGTPCDRKNGLVQPGTEPPVFSGGYDAFRRAV